MASAAAEKALAGSGLTAADIDLVVVATCSSVDRCPNVATRVANRLGIAAPGALRPQHRVLRLLATRWPPPTTRSGPAPSRNAIVIGAEKLSDFTDWTDRSHLHHLRRRRRRGGRDGDRRRRAAGHRAGRLGLRAGEGRRRPDRGLAPVHPAGGPGGLPLGDHGARPDRAAGLRAGRRGPERDRGVRRPPGQRPHHRRHRQAAQPAQRRSSPRTSSSRATPRRRASRWPCPSWSSGARCPRAPRCCSSASAAASPTPGRSSAARSDGARRRRR